MSTEERGNKVRRVRRRAAADACDGVHERHLCHSCRALDRSFRSIMLRGLCASATGVASRRRLSCDARRSPQHSRWSLARSVPWGCLLWRNLSDAVRESVGALREIRPRQCAPPHTCAPRPFALARLLRSTTTYTQTYSSTEYMSGRIRRYRGSDHRSIHTADPEDGLGRPPQPTRVQTPPLSPPCPHMHTRAQAWMQAHTSIAHRAKQHDRRGKPNEGPKAKAAQTPIGVPREETKGGGEARGAEGARVHIRRQHTRRR